MKILIYLLVLCGFVQAQVMQQEAEDLALHYFEDYVDGNFKDPYSYDLVKTWSEYLTVEQTLVDNISTFKASSSNKSFKHDQRKIFAQKADELHKELSEMSDAEKRKTAFYNVYIDAYGTNSLGNKVLGRYLVIVDINGNIDSDVIIIK